MELPFKLFRLVSIRENIIISTFLRIITIFLKLGFHRQVLWCRKGLAHCFRSETLKLKNWSVTVYPDGVSNSLQRVLCM